MSGESKPIGSLVAERDRPPALAKTGLVGRLDPFLYRETIQELGLAFRWSRALVCPCRTEVSGQPALGCPLCHGAGWWYVHPDARAERENSNPWMDVKCAFSQGSLATSITNPVLWQSGEAVMVAQNDLRVAYRDKFVGIEQEMAWTELLIRDTSSALVPVGKFARSTAVQRASMSYELVRIHHVATNTTRYYEGRDFKIREKTQAEPTKLEWLTGHGPSNGAVYVVHYACRPVWLVDDITYAIQHARGPDRGIKGRPVKQELPTAFKVRLEFLPDARGT